MLAGVAALSGVANAGEVMGVAPVTTAGAEFSAKGKETVKLRFNGRVHLDYNSLANDGTDASGDEAETTNGFYFRRLRLGAKATLASGVTAETVYDFAGEDISIDKGVIGIGDFKLGYQKVPFGFQETTSSAKIKTIERSAVNRYFADDIDFAGRHTGVHYKSEFNGLTIAGFVGNSSQGADDIRDLNQDLAYFGRVQWSNDSLTVGADYGYQQNNRDGDDDFSAFTAYVNYEANGLKVLGEYFSGEFDEAEADTDGFSVLVSYKFDKFEPVVRYSFIDSEDTIDADELIRRASDPGNNVAGELSSFYVGANYYYSKSVKFALGYEFAEAEDEAGDTTDDISGIRARVQVLF